MKKTVACASLVALFAITNSVNAEMIAFWNFNSGSNATTGSFSSSTLDVTEGSGTLTVNGVTSAHQVVFGGTVSNLPSPDPDGTGRGVALAIQGGANNANNGGFLEFGLDMSGYQDLVMSYAVQRTGTGFTANAISFSVDGAPFVDAETITDIPASFGTTSAVPASIITVDFSSFAEIANGSDVRVRLTMTGATTETGNNRFDNVQFNAIAIPEPASALLMLMAMSATIGLYRRVNR